MCADPSVTRARSPAAPLPSPSSKFNTRATNTPCGLGWGAAGHLPETEVKLEFADVGEQTSSGFRKAGPSISQKRRGRDLSLQRKRPRPLPGSSLCPAPDQAFLGEEGSLGLHVHGEKRGACSLERPGLGPAAACAHCHARRGQKKAKRHSGRRGLQSVPGQEPPVQPEKKGSKQKARGRREVGEPAGRKSGTPCSALARPPLSRCRAGQPGRARQPGQTDQRWASLVRMRWPGRPTSS